ncbi:hypothetical protein CR513_16640, partial [Mucuna pruriens]
MIQSSNSNICSFAVSQAQQREVYIPELITVTNPNSLPPMLLSNGLTAALTLLPSFCLPQLSTGAGQSTMVVKCGTIVGGLHWGLPHPPQFLITEQIAITACFTSFTAIDTREIHQRPTQTLITKSSAEADYSSLGAAATEILWVS